MAGDKADPAIGSWALYLPYDSMNAGHAIISRDAKGEPQALVLLRWSSPERCRKGELKGDTERLTESRREATARVMQQAEQLGANAVLNVRFSTSAITSGASEMLAYGTAAVVRPVGEGLA